MTNKQLIKRIEICTEQGLNVMGRAPLIISASRATDIPALQLTWFLEQWNKGYFIRINPINRKPYYISTKNARIVVFWTKNGERLLQLNDSIPLPYYVHYTVNDYEPEGWEPNIPDLQTRIKNFIQLSQKIGKERVIWRFDPILPVPNAPFDVLIERMVNIGSKILPFTQRFVFSFGTINNYPKPKKRMVELIKPKENLELDFNYSSASLLLNKLVPVIENWKTQYPDLRVGYCAPQYDFISNKVESSKCIDLELVSTILDDSNLFKQSQTNNFKLKDAMQRKNCGCCWSADIGKYNTCTHGCVYCYAT